MCQRTLAALGRKDALIASGELDRLTQALVRHSERSVILSDMESGRLSRRRIGGPPLPDRLWRELDIDQVLAGLLDERRFEFAVERAVFVSVLHRLFVAGSDQACETWFGDYAVAGADDLGRHN